MKSSIYRGRVKHRRFAPTGHEFSYQLFMMFIDLDELPDLFKGSWFWSARRASLAWFRRKDHFGDPQKTLKSCVYDLVENETGSRPDGPVRLLTHLRYFGHCFNPISLYYCYAADGETLEHVIAEVNNTPWGEQHCYVLSDHNLVDRKQHSLGFRHAKAFHVSPFMNLNMDYAWRIREPDEQLSVHIENLREDVRLFDATLSLQKRPITAANLRRVLASYPLMTIRVVMLIHLQAIKLWIKKIPFVPHPGRPAARPGESREHAINQSEYPLRRGAIRFSPANHAKCCARQFRTH